MRTAVWFSVVLGLAATVARAQQDAPPAAGPWTPAADARPHFSVLLAPGVAPAAVHVNGLVCPLAVGTPLTAHYVWDFGDPAGRYNTLVGFVAAHVYDRAGAYPVTLTVTDEAGHTTTATSSITITADNRRAVYVSPDGNDANAGDTEAAPLQTAAAAFHRLHGAKRQPDPGHTVLLFKAGGTFPVVDTLSVRGPDVVIGRYGPPDAPKPVLLMQRGKVDARGKGPHGSVTIDARCDGVMVEHLTFATPYAVADDAEAPKTGIEAMVGRGRNIAVRECSFRAIDTGIDALGNPAGLLVQDCDAPGPTDLRGFLIWGQGTDHAYLGNRVGNSTREHCIRTTVLDRVLIYGNDLANVDRPQKDDGAGGKTGDKYDGIKGCIEFHEGTFAYVAGNTVHKGPIRTGPRGGGTEKATSASDWCVIDGNDLDDAQVRVDCGSHHVMVRNNVVHDYPGSGIEVDGPDGAKRTSADLTIAHNTFVDAGPIGLFTKVWGHVDGITLADNLFVAPHLKAGVNGTAAVNVNGADLAWFTAVSHNVWPVPEVPAKVKGGVVIVGTDGDRNKNFRTAADWAAMAPVAGDVFAAHVDVDARGVPTAGGPADGAGAAVPGTAFDHDGHPPPGRPPDGWRVPDRRPWYSAPAVSRREGASDRRPASRDGPPSTDTRLGEPPMSEPTPESSAAAVNRRQFLAVAATAAVVVSLPVLQPDVASAANPREKPKPSDKPVDVGTAADYAKDGVTDTWAKSSSSFFRHPPGRQAVRQLQPVHAPVLHADGQGRPVLLQVPQEPLHARRRGDRRPGQDVAPAVRDQAGRQGPPDRRPQAGVHREEVGRRRQLRHRQGRQGEVTPGEPARPGRFARSCVYAEWSLH